MSNTKESLRNLLAELERLSSDSWPPIESWAAKARAFLGLSYPQLLDEFNKAAKAPAYPPVMLGSTAPSRWDGAFEYARRREVERNNEDAKARAAARYRQKLADTRQQLASFLEGILAAPDVPLRQPQETTSSVIYQGPVTTFAHSNVVAAMGAGSNITGSVTVSPSTVITEQMLKDAVKELQRSLVGLQEQLSDIDEQLYEALSQILLNIRKLQFGQADLATVLGRVKESVDDLWVKDALKDAKPQVLPKLAKAVELLIGVTGDPLAQGIAKTIGG